MTRRRWIVAIGLAALVAFIGLFVWRAQHAPELPPINLDGADPELVAAIEDARNAARDDPYSAAAWGKLGLVLAANDYHEPATVCFRHAAEFAPETPKWPCLLAVELLQMGRSLDALPHFVRSRELARTPDERAALLFWAARLQIELGKLDDADESVRQLAAIDRESPRLDYARGVLALARGDRAQGVPYLKKVADHPSARRRVCEILSTQAGAGDYQTCTRMPFDQPWPNSMLNELGQYKVRRRDPLDEFRMLDQQGKKDEATAVLKQLVVESPTAEVRLLLAARQIDAGEFGEAVDQLRSALGENPRLVKAHLLLGAALLGLGETELKVKAGETRARELFEDAVREEDRALELQANLAQAHSIRGRALKRLGKTPEAMQSFREAITCQPESPELHRELGESLAEAGQREEGFRHLEDAVKLSAPGDNRARESLEKWRAKRNN